MGRVIDLHAHILPGLDDGPLTLDASLAQARASVAVGVSELAATPHVDHTFGLDLERIGAARDAVVAALAHAEIPLTLRQGGEIALARLPELDDAFLRGVALGGGPWLLLECPFSPEGNLEGAVADLHARGHQVLLAHPERSALIQRDPDALARLVGAGALAQVTAGSLTGAFGAAVRTFAWELVEGELVQVIASDTHDAVHRPPGAPDLDALGPLLGWMAEAVPAAVLAGTPVPARPDPVRAAW